MIASLNGIHAQSLTGHVIDKDNNGIAFANVVLLKGNSFIKGVVTNEHGDFIIEQTAIVQDGDSIRISMIGYENFTSSIPLSGNFGTIILKESSVMLNEVIVKSNLPKTRISDNGMITSVTNSILSTAGTANDVLSKIPLVNGSDGKYTVFGRGEAVIYINGKVISNPSELDQLSSSDIKSVEVISNPGSSYSADINAVIKIRTIPLQGDGFSTSVFNSTRIAHYAISTDNLSLKYRKGNLEIFANGYFYGGKRKFRDASAMITYGNKTFQQDFNAHTIVSSAIGFGKIGFNYQSGNNHSFGAYYEGGASSSKPKGSIDSYTTIDIQPYESFNQYHSGAELMRPSHEANIYYNGTVGNLSIDFNGDFIQTNKHKDDIQHEMSHKNDDRKIISDAFNKNQLLAEKLVISYPLWNGTLELGEEYTNSSISYLTYYSGADISDGDTQVKENNFAGFTQISQKFGNLNIGLGLRFEYGNYKYYNGLNHNKDISRTYRNLYPSFTLSSQVNNVNLSFNITSRSRRPSYRQLDETVQYVNRYTYQAGNSSLSTIKTYTAQIMAQWRYLFAQALYTYEKNSIFYTTRRYNDDPLIKLIVFENIPRYQNFQLAIGAQPKCGCWSPAATIGIFCNIFTETFLDKEKKFNSPYFFLNWDNAISLPYEWVFDIDLMARSSGYRQNSYLKAAGYLNLGIRKSFFDNKFTVGLTANDIFNTNNSRMITYNGDIKVITNNYQESRNIVLTFRYNFNTSRSKYKGTGAGINEKNRL